MGENSIGMCPSCRAFQVATMCSASVNICGPGARRASASFAAAAVLSFSILRLLKPMPKHSRARLMFLSGPGIRSLLDFGEN